MRGGATRTRLDRRYALADPLQAALGMSLAVDLKELASVLPAERDDDCTQLDSTRAL